MNKAAQLSAKLEQVGGSEGMNIIGELSDKSLSIYSIDDAMCVMHDDGSVNIK